ncbi:MAG: MarC family protein [Candidatus Omnitrophica bacterium]|nr:MarC family protein [Candidatus Omnitrophota bacterium]MCM8826778.1 MarC family protein [Candidatus Omnitrophota bacterium]
MFKNFVLACIPLFVAVDAMGILPLFVSLTQGININLRRKIVKQSVITAICVTLTFVFIGKLIFKFLGITIEDFIIAGGIILFCIAIVDILNPEKKWRIPPKELGIVPLGTPLIAGPAVLTTSLIILDEYGILATVLGVVANVILAGIVFSSSDVIIKILGEAGTRAISRVTTLLLAAIAVMMVRKGIFQFIR